jgi:hypothetical protein
VQAAPFDALCILEDRALTLRVLYISMSSQRLRHGRLVTLDGPVQEGVHVPFHWQLNTARMSIYGFAEA